MFFCATNTHLLGKGSVALKVTSEYGGKKLGLNNCSYVPGLDCNLLSMRQLHRLGYDARIKNRLITVSKDGVVFVAGERKINYIIFNVNIIQCLVTL
jgi:hypothetical protein